MNKKIESIINIKNKLDKIYINEVVSVILESNKEKTYKEIIKEINQCRYELDNEILNDLISAITENALSKAIQS